MEYGLIGEKLGHSYSKPIHEKLADYTYELTPLSRDEFTEFMEKRQFKAINVTIPYKKAVIPYLDELDDAAAAIGAVNTIVNKNGRLKGYNTDYLGFIYMMRSNGIDARGKKALVLGSGGAAQAVIAALKSEGAACVLVVSRSAGTDRITYEECISSHADADLIVNTTPIGMYPNVDASPIDLTPFKKCTAVLDVIYNPEVTKLTAQARALGMKGITGLSMLTAQAKYACEFFLDIKIDDAILPALTADIAAQVYKHDAPESSNTSVHTKNDDLGTMPLNINGVLFGEGLPKLCIPIVDTSKEQISESAKKLSEYNYDVLEWRMDYFEDVCEPDKVTDVLKNIKAAIGDRLLLATFRSVRDGGNKEISEEYYKALCTTAIKSGCVNLIDVELSAGEKAVKDIVAAAHAHGCHVIVSNHDFNGTPDRAELVSRLTLMQTLGADLAKIAVMPQTPQDVLNLLGATYQVSKESRRPVITMAMGRLGLISRLGGHIFGSAMTFASAGKASAPGQIDAKALEGILKIIG